MKSLSIWLLFALLIQVAAVFSCGEEEDEEEVVNGKRNDNAVQLQIAMQGSLQNPAWSPDGDAILFTRFRTAYNEEPADLFIMNLSSGEPHELVSDGSGNVNLPGSAWNAQLEGIVFSSSRDPHDEIYFIDDSGTTGDEVQITDREDYMAYEPSVSPDGQRIVFESHVVDQEDNGVITVFRIDGTGDYMVLTNPNDDCRQPNWSPAGNKILYQRFDGSQWNIWTVNTDGSGALQITSGQGDKTDASFSPDGAWIVYSSDEGELDYANIFIIPSGGGSSRRVTNWGGYDGAPSWSPDGSKIIFESYPGDPDDSKGTAIWMIDAPI